MANKEDGCTVAFFKGRFKSIAVLDQESLLATCAYIDLNPLAAGVAETPEDSPHTSFRARIDHCRERDGLSRLRDVLSVESATLDLEQDHWLGPIEDGRSSGVRAGLMAGFSLSCYRRLVDWTSRLIRSGKAVVDAEAAAIFKRLHLDAKRWQATMLHLCSGRKLVGSVFGRAENLFRLASARGCSYVKNRGGRIAAVSYFVGVAGRPFSLAVFVVAQIVRACGQC